MNRALYSIGRTLAVAGAWLMGFAQPELSLGEQSNSQLDDVIAPSEAALRDLGASAPQWPDRN